MTYRELEPDDSWNRRVFLLTRKRREEIPTVKALPPRREGVWVQDICTRIKATTGSRETIFSEEKYGLRGWGPYFFRVFFVED